MCGIHGPDGSSNEMSDFLRSLACWTTLLLGVVVHLVHRRSVATAPRRTIPTARIVPANEASRRRPRIVVPHGGKERAGRPRRRPQRCHVIAWHHLGETSAHARTWRVPRPTCVALARPLLRVPRRRIRVVVPARWCEGPGDSRVPVLDPMMVVVYPSPILVLVGTTRDARRDADGAVRGEKHKGGSRARSTGLGHLVRTQVGGSGGSLPRKRAAGNPLVIHDHDAKRGRGRDEPGDRNSRRRER
mmetsp:Transcript_45099/g.123735  ORF Transcript_45099/g.123735 Transcript_45099/m.123735 type:complete len:245 (-) Transcript_45099:999-1733(-)